MRSEKSVRLNLESLGGTGDAFCVPNRCYLRSGYSSDDLHEKIR
jgi:hypothetical protein